VAPAAAELGRSAAEARSHSPPVVLEEPHDPRDADPDWLGEDEDRAAVRPRGALALGLKSALYSGDFRALKIERASGQN
jgi:hypothetical protein